jgi:hypothetical protein
VTHHQDFRGYAEKCREIAKRGDIVSLRETLEMMARSWQQLANEEERIAEFIHVAETQYSAPCIAASPPGLTRTTVPAFAFSELPAPNHRSDICDTADGERTDNVQSLRLVPSLRLASSR